MIAVIMPTEADFCRVPAGISSAQADGGGRRGTVRAQPGKGVYLAEPISARNATLSAASYLGEVLFETSSNSEMSSRWAEQRTSGTMYSALANDGFATTQKAYSRSERSAYRSVRRRASGTLTKMPAAMYETTRPRAQCCF